MTKRKECRRGEKKEDTKVAENTQVHKLGNGNRKL